MREHDRAADERGVGARHQVGGAGRERQVEGGRGDRDPERRAHLAQRVEHARRDPGILAPGTPTGPSPCSRRRPARSGRRPARPRPTRRRSGVDGVEGRHQERRQQARTRGSRPSSVGAPKRATIAAARGNRIAASSGHGSSTSAASVGVGRGPPGGTRRAGPSPTGCRTTRPRRPASSDERPAAEDLEADGRLGRSCARATRRRRGRRPPPRTRPGRATDIQPQASAWSSAPLIPSSTIVPSARAGASSERRCPPAARGRITHAATAVADGERHLDPEHPRPAHERREHAADERADDRGGRAGREVEAERPASRRTLERRRDRRQADRQQRGAADPLHDAARQQHAVRRGERAQRGARPRTAGRRP